MKGELWKEKDCRFYAERAPAWSPGLQRGWFNPPTVTRDPGAWTDARIASARGEEGNGGEYETRVGPHVPNQNNPNPPIRINSS